jgi:hypothetical protein
MVTSSPMVTPSPIATNGPTRAFLPRMAEAATSAFGEMPAGAGRSANQRVMICERAK